MFILLQGVSSPAKLNSLSDAVGILEHHKFNGNNALRANGLKTHTTDLPSIPDSDDEKSESSPTKAIKDINHERPHVLPKLHQQNNLHNSREIVDLSPIYENSSDACSSRDDVRSTNDIGNLKSCKINIEENNDSNSATPNSLSQTQSETSLEMGLISEGSFPRQSAKKKKKVNIVSEASVSNDDTIEIDASALKCDSEISDSPERSMLSSSTDGYLTMTGTIKRGKKKGQNIDVKLNISREELEDLEAAIVAKEIHKGNQWYTCSLTQGLHIVLWSILCMPIVTAVSGLYSFYIGTLTWYNIFVYTSEGKTLWLKMIAIPFVILLYPFLILLFTLGLGIYSGLIQLSCCGPNWWKEVCDLEKGFYGWFCNLLYLSDCSPYEVVILTDLKVVENTDMRGHSSTEDISM